MGCELLLDLVAGVCACIICPSKLGIRHCPFSFEDKEQGRCRVRIERVG